MRFKRVGSVKHGLGSFRRELAAREKLYSFSTRQNKREHAQTLTITLRGPTQAELGAGTHPRDAQSVEPTPFAAYFPFTLSVLQRVAEGLSGQLERAMIVKLLPHGEVLPHVDVGAYYALRDRYHLVIDSNGSLMTCGDEQACWMPGEIWWFDNKTVHSALNPSDESRVHVIFDVLPKEIKSS